jgi:predicted chitinase
MFTSLREFMRGQRQQGDERLGHGKQRSRFTQHWARGVRLILEPLEDRRVPSTFLELLAGPSIHSYAGVGFRENQVATLAASVNGAPDPNPNDFKVQIQWGDGQTSAADLVYMGNNGSFADYLVKGSHVYQQANGNGIPISAFATGPDGTSTSSQTSTAYVAPMPSGIPGTVPPSQGTPTAAADVQIQVLAGSTIHSYAGVGFRENVVANLAISLNGQPDPSLSGVHAEINWGDSASWTKGDLVYMGNNGSFADYLIKGSHVYAKANGNGIPIVVYASGPDGTSTSDQTSTAYVAPMPSGIPGTVPPTQGTPTTASDVQIELLAASSIQSFAGIGFQQNVVASLAISLNGQPDPNASDVHAQINWGDSASWTAGTPVFMGNNGSFADYEIKGSHVYRQPNGVGIPIVVYASGPDGTSTSDQTSTAYVSPNPNPEPLPSGAVPNSNGSVTVSYQMTGNLATGQSIPISVYWASGPHGSDALSQTPLYTFIATSANSSSTQTNTFTVPPASLTVAPHAATYLLVVADPAKNLGAQGDPLAVLALRAHLDALTAAQLQKVMPGLSAAAAQSYAPALNNTMNQFHIQTLEQRAMFLGQLAVESQNLQTWSEKYNGTDPVAYFISKYWVPTSQWTGLGASVPTAQGITLKVPHAAGANKTYDLYWSTSAKLTSTATLYQHQAFTYAGGFYKGQFAGAVPPKYTTYLLVVDPSTNQVVLAINNHLGNWSPADAAAFRGRGPIQITGRYNYQKFADYAGLPGLMTNPSMLANTAAPAPGMEAAGWFWETLYNHHLNETADSFAGQSTSAFNTAVTKVINPGLLALSSRLTNYLRIRALLLTSAAAGP